MRLTDLGWSPYFQSHFQDEGTTGCVPARVSMESKGFYKVLAEEGEFLAHIAGRIRYRAEERDDFPAVGDWVAIVPRHAEGRATIAAILTRRTVLSRKEAGRSAEEQILATNLETVFVMSSLNQEFNLRRIERYLAVVWKSGAQPVVLLSKADLCANVAAACAEAARVVPGVPVYALSAAQGQGLETVRKYLPPGRTAAFIGSSGVGKSTLVNVLVGDAALRVRPVRGGDDRGRHTTTSRQLIVLPGGGIVVDTPGMRELALWETNSGLAQAFEDVEAVAEMCRFRDCRHRSEPGCAVARAIEEGVLPERRLENYRKMEAELRFLRAKIDLRARQEQKARMKRLWKEQKRIYKKT